MTTQNICNQFDAKKGEVVELSPHFLNTLVVHLVVHLHSIKEKVSLF